VTETTDDKRRAALLSAVNLSGMNTVTGRGRGRERGNGRGRGRG
jgi:hypothetical protein